MKIFNDPTENKVTIELTHGKLYALNTMLSKVEAKTETQNEVKDMIQIYSNNSDNILEKLIFG